MTIINKGPKPDASINSAELLLGFIKYEIPAKPAKQLKTPRIDRPDGCFSDLEG